MLAVTTNIFSPQVWIRFANECPTTADINKEGLPARTQGLRHECLMPAPMLRGHSYSARTSVPVRAPCSQSHRMTGSQLSVGLENGRSRHAIAAVRELCVFLPLETASRRMVRPFGMAGDGHARVAGGCVCNRSNSRANTPGTAI